MPTGTVACKLPNGLRVTHGSIKLQDGQPVISPITHSVVIENEKTVYINGSSSEGAVAGFGLTHNVDADWFGDWMKQNADFIPIRNGAIFMEGRIDSAAGKAKDRKELRTGFDPRVTSDFEELNILGKAELTPAER